MNDTSTSSAGLSVSSNLAQTVFPLSRIRKLIKEDEDVKNVTNEAVFVVAKAAELFLQKFCWTLYETAHGEKRKTIQYRDLVHAVETVDEYFFLEDILPVAPKYITPFMAKSTGQ